MTQEEYNRQTMRDIQDWFAKIREHERIARLERALVAMLLLILAGCTSGTLCCPDDHLTTAAVGGANLATFAGEIAPVVVGALSTPTRLGAAPAPFTTTGACQGSSMTFHSLDIFGTTTYSCGTQPAPVVMNVVAAPAGKIAATSFQPESAVVAQPEHRDPLPPTQVR